MFIKPPVTGPSDMASTSTASEVGHYPSSDFDKSTSPANLVKEEGEVSDQESGALTQESDHQISEEQSYRESVREVRSFIGWNQVPEFETSASSLGDDPFAISRSHSAGKISVQLS